VIKVRIQLPKEGHFARAPQAYGCQRLACSGGSPQVAPLPHHCHLPWTHLGSFGIKLMLLIHKSKLTSMDHGRNALNEALHLRNMAPASVLECQCKEYGPVPPVHECGEPRGFCVHPSGYLPQFGERARP
jgi:hypothetical protein